MPLGADSALRLGVVADTHSQLHPRTLEHLRAIAPAAILHAGDIGDLAVLDELRAVAPVHAIRGNIDTRARDLPDVLVIDLVRGDPAERRLRILLVHIGVNGPRLRADVARLATNERADVVVCGHSHVPFIGRDRGLTVFNPGSAGPRRFHLPIVFGAMDVSPAGLRLAHVNCETGGVWAPP